MSAMPCIARLLKWLYNAPESTTAERPERVGDFKPIYGNCNVTIAAALAELADVNMLPTFAFLDHSPPRSSGDEKL